MAACGLKSHRLPCGCRKDYWKPWNHVLLTAEGKKWIHYLTGHFPPPASRPFSQEQSWRKISVGSLIREFLQRGCIASCELPHWFCLSQRSLASRRQWKSSSILRFLYLPWEFFTLPLMLPMASLPPPPRKGCVSCSHQALWVSHVMWLPHIWC